MYKKVEIPEFSVDKSFANFSKKEAGEYFKWFEGIKADRLEYLVSEVSKDYSSLVLDYSRGSILGLTKWILSKIELEPVSEKELKQFEDNLQKTPLLADVISSPTKTLSQDFISIAFDVGLYFGETVVKSSNNHKWGYSLKPKSYIHYAQPIVIADHPSDNINPRFLIENEIKFSLREEKDIPIDFLLRVYDYAIN